MKESIWRLIRSTRTEFIFLKLASINESFRRFIPRHYYYTKQRKVVLRNNIKFSLDPSDYTQWKIYSYNKDRESILAFELLKKKHAPVVLDIGSNVGEFSLKVVSKFLTQKDRTLTIYAFEPNPIAYQNFLTNLRINDFPKEINVSPFNIGLGMKRETLKLKVPADHSGAASFLDDRGGVEVDIWDLNEFLKLHPCDTVDFMKIDVECFEPFVLLGSTEIIKKFKPYIYVEYSIVCNNQHKMGESFVYDFLIGHGYTITAEIDGRYVTIPDFSVLKKIGKVDILARPNH